MVSSACIREARWTPCFPRGRAGLRTVLATAYNCMDACTRRSRQSPNDAPRSCAVDRRKVVRSRGQYVLILKCAHCGHTRDARPEVLARLAGWGTPLAAVLARLRCSQCGAHRCVVTVHRPTKRDG